MRLSEKRGARSLPITQSSTEIRGSGVERSAVLLNPSGYVFQPESSWAFGPTEEDEKVSGAPGPEG